MPTGDSPNGLKALEENRAATQFGGSKSNPRSQDGVGNRPWSIRCAIRHLAAQRVDPSDSQAIQKLLGKNPSIAQVIAANVIAKGIKADMRAAEYLTDQIDGKLIQANINADFAALMSMSDEELIALNQQLVAASNVNGNQSDSSTEERGASEREDSASQRVGEAVEKLDAILDAQFR